MRLKALLLPLVFTLATVGCIHKTGGAVTPKERAVTYNAAFAQSTDNFEQGVELAVTTGALTTAQARPIIVFLGHEKDLHKQVTAILGQATITSADLTSIGNLLDEIKKEGDAAIASGALGIKNPKSQATFKQDLDGIYALADVLLSSIQQLKGGQ